MKDIDIEALCKHLECSVDELPKYLNSLLKSLQYDHERIQALDGICTCGSLKGDEVCWGCYSSPAENY